MSKQLSILCTALFFTVILALSSCSSSLLSEDADTQFEEFTRELFCQEVSANAITLHYTLKEPERYGIEKISPTLRAYDTDAMSSSVPIENCLAALKKFPYENLSKENRLTYDVLKDYLETSLEGASFALYDEPLSPMTGIQAQLPILLSEYPFYSAEDVDNYLDLLADVPAHFDSLIAYEKAKAEAGLFIPSYTADSIIEECQSFLQMGTSNYLYSSFSDRIAQLSDLDEKQKAEYISQNETLIQESVFPAYEKLSGALTALRTSGKNNNGLCYYPDGLDYYKYLVKSETGSSRNVEELQELTLKQIQEDLLVMQDILSRNKGASAESTFLEDSALVLEDSNPVSILNHLKTKLADSFPEPPQVATEVKYVQKDMEEYLSPAFYMVPAIDNTQNNVIYINQGHIPDDLDLFTTLAHEGYPGHLYQTTYFADTDPNPVRSILNFGGYTEGWATYSEMLSYYFTPLGNETAALLQRNASILLGLYALTDIGIHYDGWTLIDTVSFFHQYGITDTDIIENIYDLIIADPANYLKYYIGYVEFLELKKETIKTWDEDFTQKKFHQAVLDIGPAPFDILREYILGTVKN